MSARAVTEEQGKRRSSIHSFSYISRYLLMIDRKGGEEGEDAEENILFTIRSGSESHHPHQYQAAEERKSR